MPDHICAFCGLPVTEKDDKRGNFIEISVGIVHVDCLEEKEQDAPHEAADFFHDSGRDT